MSRFAIVVLLFLASCEGSSIAPGTACVHGSDCADPLVCRYGRCRAECATNRDCGATQSCIVTSDHAGVCQLDVDLGCETGVGRMCSAGLVCANDRCINECTAMADCPSDGECRFSPTLGLRVCVDPGRVDVDAGPPNDGGVPTSPCATITDVCAGTSFVCALRDGEVLCWGDDSSSQHGDLRNASDWTATHVMGPDMTPLHAIVAIDCGDLHACALDAQGDVLCWGSNGAGQLANDGAADTDRASYVHVDLSDPEWTSSQQLSADRIVLGGAHSCARRAGSAEHWICWGDNANGELVTLIATGPSVPAGVHVSELDHATALGLGGTDVCFGAASGGGVCRGVASAEELGDASLATLVGVRDLALGIHHTCALTNAGLSCWGSDILGQLGDGAAMAADPGCAAPCSLAPVPVSLPGVVRLISGPTSDGTCAITDDGSLWCWGENQRGQVDMSLDDAILPIRQMNLPGDPTVCDAALGGSTVCALVASPAGGDVYCWGENGAGQLNMLPDGDAHPMPLLVMLPD